MRTDEENLRFGVQFLFSATVLFFCIYKLAIAPENQNSNALYWGGITSILAWWMPSPSSHKNNSPSIHAEAVNIEKMTDSVTEIPMNRLKN
jgi:hypothetical protein